MDRDEFLDTGALKKFIVYRTPCAPYKFAFAKRFVFALNFQEGYLLGMDYTGPLGSVRLMRGREKYQPYQFNLSCGVLPLKYPKPLHLQPSKLKDRGTHAIHPSCENQVSSWYSG